MARPLRLEYEGAVYHVTIRGNQRGIIFQENSDRERFIEKLAESVERYEIHLYLYTLMTNHVHMVLETPRGALLGSALRIVIYFLAFFSSIVYSLPLWPGLYESNMKVQCTT